MRIGTYVLPAVGLHSSLRSSFRTACGSTPLRFVPYKIGTYVM